MIIAYIFEMLIESMKSLIFLKFIMGEKLGRYWSIPVIFIGSPIVMQIAQWKDTDASMFLFMSVYGLFGIMLKSSRKEKLKKIILLIFIVGSLDEIMLISMRIIQRDTQILRWSYQVEIVSSILSNVI